MASARLALASSASARSTNSASTSPAGVRAAPSRPRVTSRAPDLGLEQRRGASRPPAGSRRAPQPRATATHSGRSPRTRGAAPRAASPEAIRRCEQHVFEFTCALAVTSPPSPSAGALDRPQGRATAGGTPCAGSYCSSSCARSRSRCSRSGAAAHDAKSPPGSLWVVNRDKGEVTVFDAATGGVRARRSRPARARTRSRSPEHAPGVRHQRTRGHTCR